MMGKQSIRGETLPSRPRRRFWTKLLAFGGFGLVLLLLIVMLVVPTMVNRRLSRAMEEAARDDPAWRFNDLVDRLEHVPDNENSAIVLNEVTSMLPKGWPASDPTPGTPNPPPTEFVKALNQTMDLELNLRLDDESVAILRNDLAVNAEAVQLARSVASFRRGSHSLDFPPNLISTLLRETQDARQPARMLQAAAAVQAHDGEIDGALESSRAILGIARSIGDEPFVVSALVRFAINDVATRAARRALGQGVASDEVLARLQADLLEELKQPLLLVAFRGERAINDEVIRRLRDAEVPIASLSEDGSNPVDPNQPVPSVSAFGRFWFDCQRAVALEWLNKMVEIAHRRSYEHPPLWKAWDVERDRVRNSYSDRMFAVLPLLLLSGLPQIDIALTRCQAALATTAVVVAADRHRIKTGAWPASIAAIDPSILKSPPVDPYTGRPLILERDGGRLLVHSVGPNLKDEHGVYHNKSWRDSILDDIGAEAWDVALRGRKAEK